jgi:hypothetical protein
MGPVYRRKDPLRWLRNREGQAVHLLITSIHDGSFVNHIPTSPTTSVSAVLLSQVLAAGGEAVGNPVVEEHVRHEVEAHGHDQVGSKVEQERHADGWMPGKQIVEQDLPPLSYDGV